jgi:hypothetical protein
VALHELAQAQTLIQLAHENQTAVGSHPRTLKLDPSELLKLILIQDAGLALRAGRQGKAWSGHFDVRPFERPLGLHTRAQKILVCATHCGAANHWNLVRSSGVLGRGTVIYTLF